MSGRITAGSGEIGGFNIGESELRHYLVVEITEPLLVLDLPNDIIKALLIFRDRYEKKVIKFKKILKIFS